MCIGDRYMFVSSWEWIDDCVSLYVCFFVCRNLSISLLAVTLMIYCGNNIRYKKNALLPMKYLPSIGVFFGVTTKS